MINLEQKNELNDGVSFKQIAHKQYVSDNKALCLDGSQSAYYFKPGSQNNKWVIYFPGKAWCAGFEYQLSDAIEPCIIYSKKTSTKRIPYTIDLNLFSIPDIAAVSSLVLSSDKTKNPILYNWNHVYIHYCDGTSFSSNLNEPIIYNNNKYYFRGRSIVDGVFNDLISKYNLLNATNIILSGSSSGGLAVYLHSNYINDKYISQTKNVSFLLLPECGFFIDHNGYFNDHLTNYSDAMKWIYNFTNATTNKQCEKYMESVDKNKNLCIFAENVLPFINIPIFIIQSKYDYFTLRHIVGFNHKIINKNKIRNEYGNNFKQIIYDKLKNYQFDNGLFLYSCIQHCYAWNTSRIGSILAFQAFDLFFNDKSQSKHRLWISNNSSPDQHCHKT